MSGNFLQQLCNIKRNVNAFAMQASTMLNEKTNTCLPHMYMYMCGKQKGGGVNLLIGPRDDRFACQSEHINDNTYKWF